jgi:rhamnosyl/mannosyltransferase
MVHILHTFKSYRDEVEGGISRILATLAHGLQPRMTSEILVARAPWGFARTDEVEGVPVRRCASLGTVWSLPVAPGYPFAFARRAAHADIIALHAPFPLADMAAGLALPRRAALVVHWHADIVRQKKALGVLGPMLRRTLRRADAIIASHERVVASSPLLAPIAERCQIVPYGVDAAPWQTRDAADEAAIAALRARHPRLVVAIGRLVGYKGFDVLLRAMARVDGQLVIIGSGAVQDRLEADIAALGLSDRVQLLGFASQTEMKRHLHAARAFALPSISAAESFALVQLEAMACGLPVVNTALPTAVPTIARHGLEGLTVPPGDDAALASALSQLLDDPALAERLGAAGRARFLAEFTNDRFVARTGAIYERALAAHRAQA